MLAFKTHWSAVVTGASVCTSPGLSVSLLLPKVKLRRNRGASDPSIKAEWSLLLLGVPWTASIGFYPNTMTSPKWIFQMSKQRNHCFGAPFSLILDIWQWSNHVKLFKTLTYRKSNESHRSLSVEVTESRIKTTSFPWWHSPPKSPKGEKT